MQGNPEILRAFRLHCRKLYCVIDGQPRLQYALVNIVDFDSSFVSN